MSIAQQINTFSGDYFNAIKSFPGLFSSKTTGKEKLITAIATLSILSVVVPVVFLCTYGVSSWILKGRVKDHTSDPNRNQRKINKVVVGSNSKLSCPNAKRIIGPVVPKNLQEKAIGNGYNWKTVYGNKQSKNNQVVAENAVFAKNATNAIIAYNGVLSNFDQKEFNDPYVQENFKSAEHMFQCYKFPDAKDFKAVQSQSTPAKAREHAQSITKKVFTEQNGLGKLWSKVSQNLMIYIQLVKAANSKTGLEKLLEESGTDFIIEDTSSRHFSEFPDKTWGDNGDGSGDDRLGWAQMKAREFIKSNALSKENLLKFFDTHVNADLQKYEQEYNKAVKN